MLTIIITVITVLLILSLIECYLMDKKIKQCKLIYKDIACGSIVQKMFSVMGSNNTSVGKIKELNDSILKIYKPKYSTIVVYDGNSYQVRATNVDIEYADVMKSLSLEKEFRNNKATAISKYITITNKNKTLLYKSAIERKIKSALYSPIYYKNMFLGYWIIEDDKEHAFDYITKEELAKLKENMGTFLENVQFQNTIEMAENTDKQTGYYNNLYLYSNLRQILTENDTSSLAMVCLKNMPDINEDFGRIIGNTLLIKTANAIKDIFSDNSIFIRYSGIRLLIVTPGSNAEVVQATAERLLNRLKNEFEYSGDTKVMVSSQVLLHTFRKQNNIEKEIQKMISYIDYMRDTNTIKII